MWAPRQWTMASMGAPTAARTARTLRAQGRRNVAPRGPRRPSWPHTPNPIIMPCNTIMMGDRWMTTGRPPPPTSRVRAGPSRASPHHPLSISGGIAGRVGGVRGATTASRAPMQRIVCMYCTPTRGARVRAGRVSQKLPPDMLGRGWWPRPSRQRHPSRRGRVVPADAVACHRPVGLAPHRRRPVAAAAAAAPAAAAAAAAGRSFVIGTRRLRGPKKVSVLHDGTCQAPRRWSVSLPRHPHFRAEGMGRTSEGDLV